MTNHIGFSDHLRAQAGDSRRRSRKRKRLAARKVAKFVQRTFALVSDAATDDVVHWSRDGTFFCIRNARHLCQSVLPVFFRHNNLGSFVRQLNNYGFHKVGAASELNFQHTSFLRDRPDLLMDIVRRKKAAKAKDEAAVAAPVPAPVATADSEAAALSAHIRELQRDCTALADRIRAYETTQQGMKARLEAAFTESATMAAEIQATLDQQAILQQTLHAIGAYAAAQARTQPLATAGAPATTTPFFPLPVESALPIDSEEEAVVGPCKRQRCFSDGGSEDIHHLDLDELLDFGCEYHDLPEDDDLSLDAVLSMMG